MATRLPSKEKIAGSNPVTRSKFMKFSLVIPCYNEEKALPFLLESLKQLDYPSEEFEIIIVDNNCTDQTVSVAQKWGVNKIVKEEHQGLTWARQRGFLAAKGDIVACLDADCRVPADWLKKAEKYLQKTNVVAVSGPYDYFDASYFFRQLSLLFQSVFYPIIPKILHFIFRKPAAIIIGGNCFIKKTVLEKIGGFDTSIKFWGEDVITAMRLTKEGKVIFSPQLKIYSSSRRFKKEGSFKTSLRYFLNYLSIYFFNKPYVREKD